MKKICLIRHGESELNLINKKKYTLFSGQVDCSLSCYGVDQAVRLKKVVKEEFDLAYISDSKRTVQTFVYSGIKAKKCEFREELRERSLGSLENLEVELFLKEEKYKDFWPTGDKSDFKHSFINHAPNGENYQDVCERVNKIIKEIDSLDDSAKILIIAHQTTIRCLLYMMNRIDKSNIFTYRIENCKPIEIKY